MWPSNSLGSGEFGLNNICEIWACIKYALKQYISDLASGIRSGLTLLYVVEGFASGSHNMFSTIRLYNQQEYYYYFSEEKLFGSY